MIKPTQDLHRVLSLPTHRWEERTDLEALQDQITAELGTGAQRVWAVQAVVLEHLALYGGVIASVQVGQGKTLISYLAGHAHDSRRVAVLVPGGLVEKTRRDFAQLAKHWKRPPGQLRVFSYSMLGRVSGATELSDYDPDLVAADECHKLHSPSAAVARRVVRHFAARSAEGVRFVGMSGTLIEHSILDYHHLLAMALGPDNMPLPAHLPEARQWARYLDGDAGWPPPSPGALRVFGGNVGAVREGVAERVVRSHGVVHTQVAGCSASLVYKERSPRWLMPRECLALLAQFKKEEQDLDGMPCTKADIARHARTLAWGFTYRWDPAPPQAWYDARRWWKGFVRDTLAASTTLDSEEQVAQACAAGALGSHGIYENWIEVRPTYKERHRAEWIDRSPLKALKPPTGGALIWTEYTALGLELANVLKVPYYGNKGLTPGGAYIEDHKPGTSAVASIAANREGRNLQHIWNRNLILNPQISGMEQLIGRTHRPGQKHDTVYIETFTGHPSISRTAMRAFEHAEFLKQSSAQPQKLLLCDVT